MTIDILLDNASSVMTVVSALTFVGILYWTFGRHRSADFDRAASLPFADEHADVEHSHG